VKFIKTKQLLINSLKLCVSACAQYYDGVLLHEKLVKQYQVDDNDLKHLLLSPGAHHDERGYECCKSCNRSLSATEKESND